MAGSKSDYLEKIVLDLVIGGRAYTPPTDLYFILSTAVYSDALTGTTVVEPTTANGYSRVAVPNTLANFPAATGTAPTVKSNANAITFPAATGSWGTIASFYVADAATGGNILYGADLTTAKAVAAGDTASFAANALQFQED